MNLRRLAAAALLVSALVAAVAHTRAASPPGPGFEPEVPAEVRSAFQDRRYADAVRYLDPLAKEEGEAGDYCLYLQGLAQSRLGEHEAGIAVLRRLERRSPDSRWLRKARFARAECHLALRQYAEAEEVYEAEAQRVMADERKDELAGVLISFADKLSTPKDERDPDSPDPDYARAHRLYGAALEFEVSRTLRDAVMFRRAEAMIRAEDWAKAREDLESYLRAFDPDWPEAPAEVVEAGRHRYPVRFKLAECLEKTADAQLARQTWQDLARALEDAVQKPGADDELVGLHADSLYRTAGTYRIGGRTETLLAIRALEDYLSRYPAGRKAVRAAFDVGSHYEAIDRHDDAVKAFQAFLEGSAFRADSEQAAQALARLTMEAKHRLGRIYLGQKRYAEAREVFDDYIRNHPAGPRWSECQEAVVEADYRAGADLKARKDYAAARDAWEGFLRQYPLDARARQIMYEFGEMPYSAADELDEGAGAATEREGLYTEAVSAWEQLVSKYPDTDESSHAQYMIGYTYEMKLRNLDRALEEYRRCTWGAHAAEARRRIAEMTERQLTLVTERTWRTTESPRIKVQMRNIETLGVAVYRLDLEDYFRKTHGIVGVEGLDTLLIDPDSAWDVQAKDYARYRPVEQEIEIPVVEGEPGVFAVRVTGGQLQATTLVIRSDLEIVVKSSKRALLVFAENMPAQAGWPGATVIVSDGEKVLFEGETGEDGVLYEKLDELQEAGRASVLAAFGGHVASNAVGMGDLVLSKGLSPRGYIYTDRPAYRPGQKVAVRAIIREVTEGSYSFKEGRPWKMEVVDSQGKVLESEELPISAFGTIHHEFVLDSFAPTGPYTVRCRRLDGPTFSGTFAVERYKLERMELAFELDRRIVFRGEPLSGRIVARYYYGAPVAGREIEYFLPDGRRRTAVTDREGAVEFSFDTSALLEEQGVELTAAIVGEGVRGSGAAFVAVREFGASVSVLRDVYLAGEPFDVTVSTRDVEDRPTGRSMALRVLKRESQPDGTWSEVLVREEAVKTDPESGQGRASVTLEKGGRYVLRATGEDRFTNVISAEAQVRVSDEEDATRLRILADGQHLKVGEQPTVVVHSRLEPVLALLTYEGEEIIDYEVTKLGAGANPVTITVGHEHFPNFALGACAMVGNRFHQASQAFTVERQLRVSVKPAKESYGPGEEAAVEVFTTDQLGTPVAAELSLALVDEALFSVFTDAMPDIREFFESGVRRRADLATTTSCTFEYRPATEPVPGALVSEEERLEREALAAERRQLVVAAASDLAEPMARKEDMAGRIAGQRTQAEVFEGRQMALRLERPRPLGEVRDAAYGIDNGRIRARAASGPSVAVPRLEAFRETAYWDPAVTTDAQGKATIKITMPDSMTRWRFTARGVTPQTLVGQATASVVVERDFFVELKLPATLMEGDAIRVTARVHNGTDYAGPARLSLRVTNGDRDTTLDAEAQIQGKRVVEHVFEFVEVPAAGEVVLALEATAGDLADGVVRRIPVQPWGIRFTDSHSGLVTDEARFQLALPAGRSYTQQAMQVRIDAGLERRLVAIALRRPEPFDAEVSLCPVPTHADTAADLLGVVSVMSYLQGSGRDAAGEWKELADRAESLIAALLVAQCEDGGWPWTGAEGRPADPRTSSLAFWALGCAKRLGVAVPDEAVQTASRYLEQAYSQAPQEANELKADILHALTNSGQGDFGYANRLYRSRQSLSTAALAYTAVSLAMMDRGPMANEVLDVLAAKREPLSGGRADQARWPGSGNDPWMRSDHETTALVLLAYLHVRPAAPEAAQAVRYLMDSQPWFPGRARGAALAALCRWFAEAETGENDYRLAVRVNGEDVAVVEVRGRAGGRTIDVPGELVKPGRNTVELQLEGAGSAHYVALVSGFSASIKPPADSRPQLGVERREYHAAPPEYNGRPVPIGFGTVTGHYRSWDNTVSQLPVGQATNVELRVYQYVESRRPQDDVDYLVVREAIPAGATVLADSVRGSFHHHEVGDGEIVFHVGPRHGGTPLRYTLIGYSPGTFRVLPTEVRALYAQDRIALGAPETFAVLPPGEKSTDPYKPTPDELYHLGKAYFDDGLYPEAHVRLEMLFDQWHQNLRDEPYRDAARMLLYTSIEANDAKKIVRYFEVLKEKYPDLVVPFDKVLAVGRAYRQLEEYERAMLVFKAAVGASFVKDAHVAGVLDEQDQPLAGVEFMRDLWRDYPDTPTVVNAYLALSDTLTQLADRAADVAELKDRKLTHDELVLDAVRLLVQYLTLYAGDPTADDAALNLVNAYLKLEDYDSTVKLCRALRARFPDSPFLDSFEYVEAVALWNLGRYERAVELALKVSETTYKVPDGSTKPSDNKDLAIYIVGQIRHAEGKPDQAIEFYEKVKDNFADAAEAIDYFRRKAIAIEEVATFEPGEEAAVTITYRNIPDAHLLVYRVDLMTLYLTEKNLSRITKVNLAGIRPAIEPLTVHLGTGKDYEEKERTVPLGVSDSGAYLVICRGEDLYASGMALVTPLRLEVQEDEVSGRVRVNVMDRESGRYLRDVHVKVVGSENGDFVAGETDLRGVFVADDIRGKATVVARDTEGEFAFYRGERHLGPTPERREEYEQARRALMERQAVDLMSNVLTSNVILQQKRMDAQEFLFQTDQKGVQVQQMAQ